MSSRGSAMFFDGWGVIELLRVMRDGVRVVIRDGLVLLRFFSTWPLFPLS